MILPGLEPLAVPLAELKPFPGNPRRGDVDAIARSLDTFGQRKPIVVTADGTVVAGNHTVLAARQLGWDRIAAVRVDDDETTAKAYNLADNRTAELGGYDETALAEHRLVCGDSTNDAVLDAAVRGDAVGCLMADPPYGINLDTDWSTIGGSRKAILAGTPGRKYAPVINDDRPFDAGSVRRYFLSTDEQFWFGADYYRRTLSEDDLDGSWLVWDKRIESSDAGFGSGFELIWSARRHKRDLLRHYWFGAFGDAEARQRMHPTQKPTKLLADILTRWTPHGCVVVDPFAGSGSTLIAAHETGRTARLIEIDPHYCDVICRRYQQATGTKAVAEASGEPVDFEVVG